jgi:hypothetical protein
MKYKVGDKVRVRGDLKKGRRYPRPDRYNLICECISDACEAIDEIMATEES